MTKSPPFRRVLIANRGEIAVRILRTLHDLGIEGIVVHHAVDAASPAVRLADRAIEIKGRSPVAAHLDAEQIVAAAVAAGAEAIHPGYGFLSENAAFARRVESSGIAFVGPSVDAIELMGDKIRARAFVAKHGFPVAPSAVEDDDPESFAARARKVGFPLLIKPSAGGGGKGMRIVRDPADLVDEIVRARSEGERYFGDGRLYVEKYIEQPRHIEVQVLGDAHGNVVHLFERECSVQRRFQKIVEETPSPALDAAQRKAICETAAGIARAANYRNAGTIEFIYGKGEFYFLEMNTRLQVEHPVTEMVTGIDLVREQLRIAAGEKLGFAQQDLRVSGHAIEFRLYAESPARGFTPTTGKAAGAAMAGHARRARRQRHRSGPADHIRIRSDAGEADRPWRRPRRGDCPRRCGAGALRAAWLRDQYGLPAPPGQSPRLRRRRNPYRLSRREPRTRRGAAPLACNRDTAARRRGLDDAPGTRRRRRDPTPARRDRRMAKLTCATASNSTTTSTLSGSAGARANTCSISTASTIPIAIEPDGCGGQRLIVDGEATDALIAIDGNTVHVHLDGQHWELRYLEPVELHAGDHGASADDVATAPMPGVVIAVHTEPGARVTRGDTLMVIESMKLETAIKAWRDGTVETIHVVEGRTFERSAPLVTFAPEAKG